MAVTLADIRAQVLDSIKRNDVTRGASNNIDYSRLDRFIRDSIRRIQRTLQTPMDEASAQVIIPTEGFDGLINIPGNLIEPLSLQVNGHELSMASISTVKGLLSSDLSFGHCRFYAREVGQYLIAPRPAPGSVFTIVYRADFNNVVEATDNLKLFDVAGDLVRMGALLEAGEWSLDQPRMAMWNQVYNTLFEELQDMNDRVALRNAVIEPGYDANGDWY